MPYEYRPFLSCLLSACLTSATFICFSTPSFAEGYRLMAAGENRFGELGIYSPQRFSEVSTGVKQVAVGEKHTLMVKADGTLWATGTNSGTLGDGTTTTRTEYVQIATDVVAAAAGRLHSIFLKSDGTLWGMGNTAHGIWPLGATTSVPIHLSPVQIDSNVRQISAGAAHILYVKSDDTLWACGENTHHQCGIPGLTQIQSPTQVATNVKSTSAGSSHSLFIKKNGSLWGMGNTGAGQLFHPQQESFHEPVQIATDVIETSAGATHSLYVKADGTLWGGGNNSQGQLGLGEIISTSGTQIATGVTHAAASESHSMFLKADGTLWAMGNNTSGQLCDGSLNSSWSPLMIAPRVREIGPGHATFSLFLSEEGILYGGSRDTEWYLGREPAPPKLKTLANDVVDVKPLASCTLFITQDGTLHGMGNNFTGSLGVPGEQYWTSGRHLIFKAVTIDTQVARFLPTPYIGYQKSDGSRWGAGHVPRKVMVSPPPLTLFLSYATAPQPSLLHPDIETAYDDLTLYTDGTLRNQHPDAGAETGNGEEIFQPEATLVSEDISQITTTASPFGLAYLKTDGTLWIPSLAASAPLADSVVRISGSATHLLILKSDDTLWGVGNNNGALGVPGPEFQNTPLLISTDVTDMAAGYGHSCFIKTGATLWTTGNNQHGQLADGTRTHTLAPIRVAENVHKVYALGTATLYLQSGAYTPDGEQILAQAMTNAGLLGGNIAPDATPHNDGVPNLLKFAFGMDLTRSDTSMLTPNTGRSGLPIFTRIPPSTTPPEGPGGSWGNATFSVEYVRRKNAGITYLPLKSQTLEPDSWEPMTPSMFQFVIDIDSEWERVINDETISSDLPKLFGRIGVEVR